MKKGIILHFVISTLYIITGCTDLDPLYENIDRIDKELSDLQESVKVLKEAWEKSKTIADLQPLPSNESHSEGGWSITFTDGTFLEIWNGNNTTGGNPGKDGNTPYLSVDGEGFWMVTYNGEDYEYILDREGNKIKHKGNDGKDGTSIRVRIDENECYVFEIYDSGVVETIPTPYTSNPAYVIKGVVRNDRTGTVTFYMADGSEYDFKLQMIVPAGIIALNIDSVVFTKKEEEVELDFRINPSNINFNYNVESSGCQISLEYIDLPDTELQEKENPVILYEIKETLLGEGKKIAGQYTMTLKDTGKNLYSYRRGVYLNLWYKDSNDDLVFISSNPFIVEFKGYDYLELDQGVPVIVINTPSEIVSKDLWTEKCDMEIWNFGSSSSLQVLNKVNIKGRGNSTWLKPKKPYAIKLDKKEEIFGFPKHKRWVLLANYFDKTNLRNEIAFQLSRMSARQGQKGLEYTPRSKFVRIIMNGEYQGLYLFTEQIKIDENRVNVGDDGFLVEIDSRAGSDPDDIYFSIPQIQYPIVIKDPDVTEGDEDYLFLENYLKETGEVLFSENFKDETTGYQKYIDLVSFIDWYIVNEITKNSDATFFSSCYMNLTRKGKLKMGPVWDFDVALGNYPDFFSSESHVSDMNNPEGFYIKNASWFARIFSDPNAVRLLKERFSFYYFHRHEIFEYLSLLKNSMVGMLMENEIIWHFYSNPFSEEATYASFTNDCNDLHAWLEQRYEWLYKEIEKL